MKVQLIVVRGKPEGKVIPLAGPKFKIGRGEGCHLRPNSDQVSREHAEFTVEDGVVSVQDLKSRNGTQVNGKTLDGSIQLKDRDLVQVGPLTFAVSIQGAPAAAKPAAPAPGAPSPKKPAAPAAQERSAPEDVLSEDIDSWLVGAPSESSTEIPTSVYGGETVTIGTYQGGAETPPASASADDEEDEEEEEEELEEEEEEEHDELDDEDETEDDEDDEDEGPVDEFIDESNPFHAAKKAQQRAAKSEAKGSGAANQQFQDTSGAASEILRKLMERRRASR